MKIEIKHKITGSVLVSCETKNIKMAVELAIKDKVDLSYADLRSANLSYADLSSANLSSADLRSADLRSANLSAANLRSANLSSANLSSADLRSANLSSANLSSANLSSANLSAANLSSANLSSADLRSADLDYTNIPMWCGTLNGIKVDFILVCQMLLHIFALDCKDKRFFIVKKAIQKYVELSTKWEYYIEKQKEK